ncbi:MAG TPA: YqgE/AlgH family protein [Acidimicrobiales bacterium]|nr:YqgE/AlgH family protein [Acidimicrobiales bacterium]
MTSQPLSGRLLVATPILGDPNFDRTVVLVIEHSGEGGVGLVLNRPSDTDVAEPLPEWDSVTAVPSVIFVGGPVAQSAVIGLGRCGDHGHTSRWRPLGGGLGIVDLAEGAPDTGTSIEALRLFAGYAGWGSGQLEAEIDAGAWWIVDALPSDALSPDPERLWSAVLRRQPGRLAMHAFFPADPSSN